VQAAAREDPAAAMDARTRHLVAYAVKLTRIPQRVGPGDVQALRDAGLGDAAIHDAAAVTAYFNFVNRIALGLGVELEASAGVAAEEGPGTPKSQPG
jgi:alkylhydroperoxidase family enzyme